MKNLLVFLFLLAFQKGFGQLPDVRVDWGPSHRLISTSHYASLYGADKSGFHLLREGINDDRVIEKYDTAFNMIYKEKLVMPKRKNTKLFFEGVAFLNKQHLAFASIDDLKERKSFAFAYPIDEKGNIGSQFKVIDEQSNEGRKTTNFDFQISKDTSKLLVYFNEPFHKYKNEAFSFKVYDKLLNLLWEKDVTLPYKDGFFEISDSKVDNFGNVFVLAYKYPDVTQGERHLKTEESVRTILLGCNYNTGVISQYELKLPEKWVESVTYGFNEEGTEVIVGGFYADNDRMSIKGVFFMSIDIASGKVLKTSIKEFDKEFMSDLIGENKAEKGAGLKNFKFDYFLTKKNGGIYLIAEQYVIRHGTLFSGYNNYNNLNDIIVINVNHVGDVEWIKRIYKKSYDTKGGQYLSYSLNYNKEKDILHFVFNDNPKNFELFKKNPNKLLSLGEMRYSVAALVTINNVGEMTRTPLFSNKDLNNVVLQPRIFLSDEQSIIVHGIKGRDYRFGKITFK